MNTKQRKINLKPWTYLEEEGYQLGADPDCNNSLQYFTEKHWKAMEGKRRNGKDRYTMGCVFIGG